MHRHALILLLLLASAVEAGSPATANAAAARDLVRQSATSRPYLRYLSGYAVPAKELTALRRAVDFWINSLSREAELVRAVRVTEDLFRIDLRDYQLDPVVWDLLADRDPYFHQVVEVVKVVWVTVDWGGGKDNGLYYRPGKYQVQRRKKVRTVAAAPWLDATSSATLIEGTQSRAPIVRADWFLVETSVQVDRKGTGYWDFLKVKNRADYQALVGLDEKLAARLQKETRAIVARSGAALNNRQIVRFATVTGAYWVTLDANANTARRNAIRNLDADFLHDAEEIYGNLPNGLFAFFAGNAVGARQDTVPDNIASDSTAPGNDRRIHPVGCVRCHVEGIRPIDDWARKVYRSPLALVVAEKEKFLRLRRLYLSDLQRLVKRDQTDYTEVLHGLTGLKPAEMARTFGRIWGEYQEADLRLADVARETGYAPERIREVLVKVATLTPPLDPVFAGLIAAKPETIRREHLEEGFGVLMTHLGGYLPSNAKVKVKP